MSFWKNAGKFLSNVAKNTDKGWNVLSGTVKAQIKKAMMEANPLLEETESSEGIIKISFLAPQFELPFEELQNHDCKANDAPTVTDPLESSLAYWKSTFSLVQDLLITLTSDEGGFITPTVYVPPSVWKQSGVKIPGFALKLSSCQQIFKLLSEIPNTIAFHKTKPEYLATLLTAFLDELMTIQSNLSFVMEGDLPSSFASSEGVEKENNAEEKTESTGSLPDSPSNPENGSGGEPKSMAARFVELSGKAKQFGGKTKDFGYSIAKGASRFTKQALPTKLTQEQCDAYILLLTLILQKALTLAPFFGEFDVDEKTSCYVPRSRLSSSGNVSSDRASSPGLIYSGQGDGDSIKQNDQSEQKPLDMTKDSEQEKSKTRQNDTVQAKAVTIEEKHPNSATVINGPGRGFDGGEVSGILLKIAVFIQTVFCRFVVSDLLLFLHRYCSLSEESILQLNPKK